MNINYKILIFSSFFIFLLFLSVNCSYSYSVKNLNFEKYNIVKFDSYNIKHEQKEKTKSLFILSRDKNNFLEYSNKKIYLFKDIVSSHWNTNVEIVEIEDYRSGLINNYDIIFFIKENRDNIPFNVLLDLSLAKNKKIIILGFNGNEIMNFIFNTNILTKDIVIDQITYKKVIFDNNNLNIFIDLNDIKNKFLFKNIKILAEGESNKLKSKIPISFLFDNSVLVEEKNKSDYIVFPFLLPSYYKIKDYTIIFLDLLYEIIDKNSSFDNKKLALLRIEDVNPYTYLNINKLYDVYNFLKKENIPFHIAYIPRYLNPSKNLDITGDETIRFSNLLKKMLSEGLGVLVQHGYTHQIKDEISGMGFEFWDFKNNKPLEYDSEEFVLEKISLAQKIVKNSGLPVPDIWETPHYALSDLDDEIINKIYPIRYEHVKKVGTFPFVLKKEETIYIPENLGFITDNTKDFIYGSDIDTFKENLQYLSVFRNHIASFFWHPWRDIKELKDIIYFLKEKGYVFISVYDLVETQPENLSLGYKNLLLFRNNYKEPLIYKFLNFLIYTLYFLFIIGCLFYLYTVFKFKKYLKIIDNFNLSINKLKKIVKEKGKKLPRFAIFVPARNEADVIGNTIIKLCSLDYPKKYYKIFIIVDERELDDNLEITTKEVAEKIGNKFNSAFRTKIVECIEVPKWYSGIYGDLKKSYNKSTKGRALNFALQTIKNNFKLWNQIDMIGVLDADGRLHKNVLKEVAYKRITKKSMILQGPVFQFSNFKNINIVGILAGLELAIHHLTELPSNLLRYRIQFLAGTNYFIDKNLISEVGGWNQNALVEDAELALRIYIKTGITANWIGCHELEQSPPNFSVYKKQRKRWVRGHLDLIKLIYNSKISLKHKASLFWKIFISQFRFILDIGIPVIAFIFLFKGFLMEVGLFLSILSIILLLFSFLIWSLYGYVFIKISKYIDSSLSFIKKIIIFVKLFLFTPIFTIIQSIPRIQAFFEYIFSIQTNWYKTERTKEVLIKN